MEPWVRGYARPEIQCARPIFVYVDKRNRNSNEKQIRQDATQVPQACEPTKSAQLPPAAPRQSQSRGPSHTCSRPGAQRHTSPEKPQRVRHATITAASLMECGVPNAMEREKTRPASRRTAAPPLQLPARDFATHHGAELLTLAFSIFPSITTHVDAQRPF